MGKTLTSWVPILTPIRKNNSYVSGLYQWTKINLVSYYIYILPLYIFDFVSMHKRSACAARSPITPAQKTSISRRGKDFYPDFITFLDCHFQYWKRRSKVTFPVEKQAILAKTLWGIIFPFFELGGNSVKKGDLGNRYTTFLDPFSALVIRSYKNDLFGVKMKRGWGGLHRYGRLLELFMIKSAKKRPLFSRGGRVPIRGKMTLFGSKTSLWQL